MCLTIGAIDLNLRQPRKLERTSAEVEMLGLIMA